MQVYTLAELFCMTRDQLFALHARIAAELDVLLEGSPERGDALLTLRNIRRVLAQFRQGP